jgi:hypothetical protein
MQPQKINTVEVGSGVAELANRVTEEVLDDAFAVGVITDNAPLLARLGPPAGGIDVGERHVSVPSQRRHRHTRERVNTTITGGCLVKWSWRVSARPVVVPGGNLVGPEG